MTQTQSLEAVFAGPLEPLAFQRGPGLHLVLGPRELPAWTLSALCPALAAGARVHWIDAGNCFPAYAGARAARVQGLSPRETLGRVSLARPFTGPQLAAMLGKLALVKEPVVLCDPLALFYDDEVEAPEAYRSFRRFLSELRRLPHTLLGLAIEREVPAERRGWLEALVGEARNLARLEERGGGRFALTPVYKRVVGPGFRGYPRLKIAKV